MAPAVLMPLAAVASAPGKSIGLKGKQPSAQSRRSTIKKKEEAVAGGKSAEVYQANSEDKEMAIA
jgi:hypothetical protein